MRRFLLWWLIWALVAFTLLMLSHSALGAIGGAQPTATGGSALAAASKPKGHSCPLGTVLAQTVPISPIINVLTGDKTDKNCNPVSVAGSAAGSAAAGAAGSVAGSVGTGIMGAIAGWLVDGAKTMLNAVVKVMQSVSTPVLSQQWFTSIYGYMALLGAGLAGIAAMIGLMAAALKRSPEAMGELVYGIFRAGIVTGMVLPLIALALTVADAISADVVSHMPATFTQTLTGGWGASGLGSFASSALAALIAIVEIVISLILIPEMLFREAAIMLAAVFVPLTLALAIWPRLRGTHHKLMTTLGVFIVMKPVVLICMLVGGAAAAGGVSTSVAFGQAIGDVIDGAIILAVAAYAPWGLLKLIGVEAGGLGRSRRSSSSRSDSSTSRATGGPLESAAATGAVGGVAGAAGAAAGGTASQVSQRASSNSSGSSSSARTQTSSSSNSSNKTRHVSGDGGSGESSGKGSGSESRNGTHPSPIAAAAGWLGGAAAAARPAAAAAQSVAQSGSARIAAATGGHGQLPDQHPLAAFQAARRDSGGPVEGRSAASTVTRPVDSSAPASTGGPAPSSAAPPAAPRTAPPDPPPGP